MSHLPSKTVRIYLASIEAVLREVAPKISGKPGICEECGARESETSPVFITHSQRCESFNLYMKVRKILTDGILPYKRRKP